MIHSARGEERRLILLRHGQTEYNAKGIMQGQLDTPLSAHGYYQAQSVARCLANWKIGAIFSSDLQRAYDTAQEVARYHNCEVQSDSRLRETDLGQWEGCSHQYIDEKYPGQRSYWRHNPQWSPPGGESRVQVAHRVVGFVEDLMSQPQLWDNGTVVLVAHGGAIAAATVKLLQLPLSHYPIFLGLGNTSWSQLVARPHPSQVSAVDKDNSDPGNHWYQHPQWYLEGWNISVQGNAEINASPDEGGEETSTEKE